MGDNQRHPTQPPPAKWLCSRDGAESGPFTSQQLQTMASQGELLPTDFLWKEGMKDWVQASETSLTFPAGAEENTAIVAPEPSEEAASDDALAAFLAGTPRKPISEGPRSAKGTNGNAHNKGVTQARDGNSLEKPAPREGFRGLVDAFREGMREADEKEQQEKAKDAEVLVEDISWFQKSLGELLEPGEAVCFQLEGLDLSGLVCTDRRVFIFHTGHFTWMLGNVRSFHATYDQIISVSLIEERIRIQPLLGGGYVFEVVTPEMQAGATVSGSMFEFAAEPNRIAFGKDKAAKLEKVVAFVREKSESLPPVVSTVMNSVWFVRRGSQDKKGPFSAEQMKTAATQGKLLPSDLLWKEGLADWVPASKVKGLFAATTSASPATEEVPPHVAATKASAATAMRRGADPQTQLINRTLENLFSNHLPSITAGSSSLIARNAIPPKKLDGVRQYRADATEKNLWLIFDSTMFGSASEGFAILEDGIAWRNSGSSVNGWKPFEKINAGDIDVEIESGMLGTKYLVLGKGEANRIKCGALDGPTLERLVALLARAAKIARGTDVDLLRSKAQHAASASDYAAAAMAWAKAADDPDAVGSKIVDDVRAAIEKNGGPEPLTELLADLISRAADRSQRWSLKQAGQRVSRLVTANELAEMWSAGQLFHDDHTRHFGEPEWYSVADAEPIASLPRIYFRDTGPYEPKRFEKVISVVRGAIGDASPLFLGPVASEDIDGLHWCICDSEVVRVVVPDTGEPVVERVPVAWAGLRLLGSSKEDPPSVTGHLRFGDDSCSVSLPRGPGVTALREAWKRVALASASESAAKEKLFECQRTLADAFPDDETDAAVVGLRKASKPFVEAMVDYHGGHPHFTEQCRGVLRLDEKGLEYVPVAFNSNGYMRIPYADVVEVAPPVLGEVPEEIQSSHASKQAAGAALSIAAAFLVGGQAGRAVGRSMRPDQAAVKPPKNRLGISIRSEGTTYKLFFDVAGGDRDALEKTAKDFWASAATVRGRFGKKAAQVRVASRGGGGDSAGAVAAGSHSSEIRDLLLLCIELQITGPIAEALINTNRFTAKQLEARHCAAVEKLAAVLSAATTGEGGVTAALPSVQITATGDGSSRNGAGGPASRPADDKATKASGRMSAATAAAIGLGVGVVAAGVASAAMASGGSVEDKGNDESADAILMDLDHDGRADAVGVDTDGDGDIDTVGVDRDGDGTVDAVAIDTDNDGRIDTVGTDTDGDGDVDAVVIDADGDGEADAIAMDTDNDGAADVAAIDGDGDGDVDAVAMDTDHDGAFDALAVDDDDDHDTLTMDDGSEESAEEADDEDDDDAGQYADDDDADFDFEV